MAPLDPKAERHREVLRELAHGMFRHQFRLISAPRPRDTPERPRKRGRAGGSAIARYHFRLDEQKAARARLMSRTPHRVLRAFRSPYAASPGWPPQMARDLEACRTKADHIAWQTTWAAVLSGATRPAQLNVRALGMVPLL